MTELKPRPISQAEFEPYGSLVPIEEGPGRWDFERVPKPSVEGMRLFMTILGYSESSFPHEVPKLERHEWSDQLWLPLGQTTSLIVVADDTGDGQPDPTTAKAFLAGNDWGVCYNALTWHMPATMVSGPGTMAMTMWMDQREVTHLVDLPHSLTIDPS